MANNARWWKLWFVSACCVAINVGLADRSSGQDRPAPTTITSAQVRAELERAEQLHRRGQALESATLARQLLARMRQRELPNALDWRCHALLMELERESGDLAAARRSGNAALRRLHAGRSSSTPNSDIHDLALRLARLEVQQAYPDLRLVNRLLPYPALVEPVADARAALQRAEKLYHFALSPAQDSSRQASLARWQRLDELARLQLALGNDEQAQATWQAIHAAATKARDRLADQSTSSDYPALTRLMAAAEFGADHPAAALDLLRAAVSHQPAWSDAHEQAAWLAALADIERELADSAAELRTLTQGLSLLAAAKPDQVDETVLYQRAAIRASLLYRLALAQTEDISTDPAARRDTWQQAIDACHEVLRRLPADADDHLRVRLRCLTRLQNGYLELGDTRQSIFQGEELLPLLDTHVVSGDLRHAQVRAALGRAYLQQGDLPLAAQRLDESLAAFDHATGRAADARAQALLGRANVYVASGSLDEAVKLLLREEGTCAKSLPVGSPTLAQLYTSLGSMLALQGRYADAKPRFDRAIEVLTIARAADPGNESFALALGTAQLNAAAMQRAQGKFDEALADCAAGIQTLLEIRPANHADLLSHYLLTLEIKNVQAQRLVRRDDLSTAMPELDRLSQLASEIVRGSQLEETPTDARLQNQRGTCFRLKASLAATSDDESKSLAQAKAAWKDARRLAARHKMLVVEAQVLNQLAGLLSYQVDTSVSVEPLVQAADLLDAALQLLSDRSAFPNLRYATLVNRAGVLMALTGRRSLQSEDDSQLAELRQTTEAHLREAVAIAEQPRAGVLGDESVRAGFFSNYAVAYDLLVDLLAERFDRDGSRETLLEAVFVAEASRNRTLLDQVHAAGLTAQQTLGDAAAQPADSPSTSDRLATIDAALRAIDESAASVATIPPATIASRRDQLLQERNGLLNKLAEEAAETSQQLATQTFGSVVFRLDRDAWRRDVDQLLQSGTLVLAYHVGQQRSHAFLFGNDLALHDALTVDRALHEEVPQLEVGAVSPTRLAMIVDRLRTMFSSPTDSRDLIRQLDASPSVSRPAGRPSPAPDNFVSSSSQPVTARRVDVTQSESYPFAQIARGMSSVILCDAFVAQLEEISRHNPTQQLVIVPDASLHRLPFEALVIDDRHGSDRAFLLDLDVATAYAPSLSIIARLQQLPLPRTDEGLVALTGGIRDHTAWGLDSLQHAEDESSAIRDTFAAHYPPEKVSLLQGAACSEKALREQLAAGGCRYLHLATHAEVSTDDASKVRGRILLSPPAAGAADPQDDGQLLMEEIPTLQLQGCELAVLSACQTNIGAEVPLETDASFARALFAAGVRRVVASQWSVSDRGTRVLMESFVQHLPADASSDTTYALALRHARRQAKSVHKAPFFWAPFILLGPAN